MHVLQLLQIHPPYALILLATILSRSCTSLTFLPFLFPLASFSPYASLIEHMSGLYQFYHTSTSNASYIQTISHSYIKQSTSHHIYTIPTTNPSLFYIFCICYFFSFQLSKEYRMHLLNYLGSMH